MDPCGTKKRVQGIELVTDLMEEYGEDVVLAYMGHIMKAAEESVRALLKTVKFSE